MSTNSSPVPNQPAVLESVSPIEKVEPKEPKAAPRRSRKPKSRNRNNNAQRQAGSPNNVANANGTPAPKSRGRAPGGRMTYEDFVSMAESIQKRTNYKPKLAIICGSGLGPLADGIEDADKMKFDTIPRFPKSTVEGHDGELVFGKLSGIEVVAMRGRFHPYEGYPLWKVASPIRLFHCLGVKVMIVSNAAGGLNSNYKVGDIMLIKDHLNFLGFANQSPLTGPNLSEFGPRFPAVSKVYNRDFLKKARTILTEINNNDASFLHEGVYGGVGGPTYETVAECKFLKNSGADAVGMSTTQEVVVAAHCGIQVLGVSLITNEAIMDYETEATANHEEVLAAAKAREPLLTEFASRFVAQIKDVLLAEEKTESVL